MQGIRDAFFSTLRTKQQTGYLVQSIGQEIQKELFDLFAVQSNSHGVRELLDRFELFIEGYMQELTTKEIPPERFETFKETLISQLNQPPKNMGEMGDLLFEMAFEKEGDFYTIENDIKALKLLSYDRFTALSKEFLGRQNKRRLAVLLQGSIPQNREFHYLRIGNLDKMKNLFDYGNPIDSIANQHDPFPSISQQQEKNHETDTRAGSLSTP